MVEKSHFLLIASIASILAFAMFCGCGGLLVIFARKVGPNSSERTAIQRIIEIDHTLNIKYVTGSNASELARGVRAYIANANALDLSGCPAEFRVAYRRHLEAWRSTAAATDEMPDSIVDAVVLGAINSSLRGELDGGQSRLDGKLHTASESVRSTWYAVEDIAVKYGVAL